MNMKCKQRVNLLAVLMALAIVLAPGRAIANEDAHGSPQSQQVAADADAEEGQDAQTKAMDSTATQWSFQFAFQAMPDYYQDTLDNGQTRPVGSTDYFQARIVLPVPLKGRCPLKA